jgi:hypothetical protein
MKEDHLKLVYCIVAISVLAISCEGRFDCKPRTVAPTGSLEKDIIGSWDSFGIDSRVVFTFHGDGGITIVEEPNPYAPNGTVSSAPYRVLDRGVVIDSNEHSASISESSLTLGDDGGVTRVHGALTCKGTSFE